MSGEYRNTMIAGLLLVIIFAAVSVALIVILPFPYGLIAGLANFITFMLVIRALVIRRMKDTGSRFSTGGFQFGGFGNGSRFACMNCGYGHNKVACPKCGSRMKKLS